MIGLLFLVTAAVVLLLCTSVGAIVGAVRLKTDAEDGQFATSNGQIVNAEGTPVRIVGINW